MQTSLGLHTIVTHSLKSYCWVDVKDITYNGDPSEKGWSELQSFSHSTALVLRGWESQAKGDATEVRCQNNECPDAKFTPIQGSSERLRLPRCCCSTEAATQSPSGKFT